MLARLRSQLSLQQRRAIGSSRKLPKSKPLAYEPPTLPREPPTPREPLTSEAERPKDFRNPWLFKAVGVGNFIIIPGPPLHFNPELSLILCSVIGIYAAFYWDWGDNGHDNVMQPVCL